MTVKDRRPKNLNLLTIHFPIPAIASILHRISGVILFFAIPFLLWMLNYSLLSPQSYDDIHDLFTRPLSKFIIWIGLSSLIFHFIAGIRHLLMDIHVGESLEGGRISAWITIALSSMLIILLGIWLW